MKEEILMRLGAVVNTLDNVSVKGKQNLDYISGSISVLDGVMKILSDAEIIAPEAAAQTGG